MYELLYRLIDENSFFEIKRLYVPEIVTGFARLGGQSIGIIANQPKVKGGALFVESADKAARFIQLSDAFNIPLLFLADVPGFMIGTRVEREGIIRAGAKMIMAVSEATVPKIFVIVRKAYGDGLYAMCGPGYEPDCCLVLPTAMIAVMGPKAAVNAVFYNKIMEKPEEERPSFIEELREEYREDVDIFKLASRLIIDTVVSPFNLRDELIERFKRYESKKFELAWRKHAVVPM